MKKFIDWSRVDYVLALDPPSDLNLGSEIKTIFLRRLKSVINTKLNPRLVCFFMIQILFSMYCKVCTLKTNFNKFLK